MDWAKRAKDIVSIVTNFPACDVTAAVAERLHRVYDEGLKGHGGRYRTVEVETEDRTPWDVTNGEPRVHGPIGDALLVVYPREALQNVQAFADLEVFRDGVVEGMRAAGFTEEVLIVPDDIKFARFELEGEDDGQAD